MGGPKGDKIQIVAFSTNESDHNPNSLINTYLENTNHLLIKKTSVATAFTTMLPNTSKQIKIMICSVLNLSKEYTGITDVNCYLLYIDLEKEDSKEKFDAIMNYAKEYCDLGKKIYVFGMTYTDGKKYIEREAIENDLIEAQVIYEYNELNLNDKKNICDSFSNVFEYSLKIALPGDNKGDDKDDGQAGSCDIF